MVLKDWLTYRKEAGPARQGSGLTFQPCNLGYINDYQTAVNYTVWVF